MMELFDKKFVHFMWDDELKGKRGFLSSGIDTLIKMVNEDSDRTAIQKGCERDLPFCKHITVECRLAYYDPNYEVKKAFNEGKKVQAKEIDILVDWADCDAPLWSEDYLYRIKPEEEKWIAYLVRQTNGVCYLTACRVNRWEFAQKTYGAKTKLFIGTEDEAKEWYKTRQKFAEVIKAWEDGKRIQVTPKGTDKWVDLHCEPTWDIELEYRVKPEEKQYHPYESSAEMIVDFIDRFKVKCPSYCEPLIWLSLKEDERNRFLVTGFHEDSIEITKQPAPMNMSCVFEKFVYLDGSPVGMEVKE